MTARDKELLGLSATTYLLLGVWLGPNSSVVRRPARRNRIRLVQIVCAIPKGSLDHPKLLARIGRQAALDGWARPSPSVSRDSACAEERPDATAIPRISIAPIGHFHFEGDPAFRRRVGHGPQPITGASKGERFTCHRHGRTSSAAGCFLSARKARDPKYPRPSNAQARAREASALRCSKVRSSQPRSARSRTSRKAQRRSRPCRPTATWSGHDPAVRPLAIRPCLGAQGPWAQGRRTTG